MLTVLLKGSIQHYLRSGRRFRRLLSHLESNAGLSYEQLLEYQSEQLRRSIQHAYSAVPYYQNLFNRLGLLPNDFQTAEDLKRLPIISSEDLRGHESEFVARGFRVKFKTHTSGTTGSPLTLWRDLFSVNFEQASRWRQWRSYGLDIGDQIAYLRGILVAPADRVKPPFWQYIPASKQLVLSSYHLSDELIPYYLEKLRSSQPAAIRGIPSTIFRMARFMQLRQESPIPVKAVFTTSEKLIGYQKELIEHFFGPVFDFYGNAERVALIVMCEQGTYHYMMDYSIVEFVPRGNELYEVVGTTLHNRAMPLLRYATGDLVRLSDGLCSCGRPFPVVKSIQGRQEDAVVTPSGRWLFAHLAMAFKGVPNLVKSQIIQEELDCLRVLVVPTDHFSADDKRLITRNLRKVIGDEMSIVIEEVAEITPTKQGKHQFIVSKIAAENDRYSLRL